MPETKVIQTPGPGEPFERGVVQRRDLRPDDVAIEIAFAGICHSDIHQARDEWFPGTYPMVPGHEITGTVTAVGGEVGKFAVGDRVGVGCFVDSCGECEYCEQGEEQYCSKGPVLTYNGHDYDGEVTYGGYSRAIVVKERFVVRVPDEIELDVAAPLLCAGITTYSPLRHWNVGPGKRVAIVGMGGLGHVGVQLARAMGAEVTVLSHTLSKRDDGIALGAHDYHAISDPETFKDLRSSFDLILNTVSANLPVDRFLGMLRVDGSLVNVGLPIEPDSYRVFFLTGGRKSIAGSNVGGIRETQEMLDFCAEHGIAPIIEKVTADEVGDAYERVVASQVRYRCVIDVATIG